MESQESTENTLFDKIWNQVAKSNLVVQKAKGVKISTSELKKHNSEESLWISVHGKVFDLTEFAQEHPGGWEVLEENAGKDATDKYEDANHTANNVKDIMKYYQGELELSKEEKQKREDSRLAKRQEDAQGDQAYVLGAFVILLLILMIIYFVTNI